jgi:hypothetical protein
MAVSHKRRSSPESEYYNGRTVEFTLLTFSYFRFKTSGVGEQDWFFFWKVFGSTMGLPPDRLHSSFAEAESHMRRLYREDCPVEPTPDSKKLLNLFIDCYLNDTARVRESANQGLISRRMHGYMASEHRWPREVVWQPSETDIL